MIDEPTFFGGATHHGTSATIALTRGAVRVQRVTSNPSTLDLPELTSNDVPGGPRFYVINDSSTNALTVTRGATTVVVVNPLSCALINAMDDQTYEAVWHRSYNTGHQFYGTETSLPSEQPATCKPAKYVLVACDDEEQRVYTSEPALAGLADRIVLVEAVCYWVLRNSLPVQPEQIVVTEDFVSCEACDGETLPPGDGPYFPCLDSDDDAAFEACVDATDLTSGDKALVRAIWYGTTATTSVECMTATFGALPGSVSQDSGDCASGDPYKWTDSLGNMYYYTYTGGTTTCDGDTVCEITVHWLNGPNA